MVTLFLHENWEFSENTHFLKIILDVIRFF